MRYRFVGTDGSLGYRNGQVYDLQLAGGDRPKIVRPHPCPYGSRKAFERNWQRV